MLGVLLLPRASRTFVDVSFRSVHQPPEEAGLLSLWAQFNPDLYNSMLNRFFAAT